MHDSYQVCNLFHKCIDLNDHVFKVVNLDFSQFLHGDRFTKFSNFSLRAAEKVQQKSNSENGCAKCKKGFYCIWLQYIEVLYCVNNS